MNVQYDPDFIKHLKSLDVRIRKSFKKQISLFAIDPFNPQLRNHSLQREYSGYNSIDIINDWRALYKEKREGEELIYYFVAIGTHEQLYG